jgi:hypothetical protein
MTGSWFHRSWCYVFLISFACAYYLVNAPLLLGHYDLGWHLAAGDLIRHDAHIPSQDPWSFTSGGAQWFNLSWSWDVIASVLFQYIGFGDLILLAVACGAVIVGYLTSVCLWSGASAGLIAACALPLIYIQIDPALGLPEMVSEQDVLYLQTHFQNARLLNHWNYGGILIFRTRGSIPVFVDGRAATAYPDALLHDYFKLSQLEINETAGTRFLRNIKSIRCFG